MTFAHKNVKAFIHLLQNTPELFSYHDRQSLADQIPEDIEEISASILAWCEQRPEINNALREIRRTLGEYNFTERGPGGTFPDFKTHAEDERNLKETLLNALRQSSPPGKKQTSIS